MEHILKDDSELYFHAKVMDRRPRSRELFISFIRSALFFLFKFKQLK